MGNESSQLERPDEMPDHRRGRVIGPSMSPTPSDDERIEHGRVIGPSMSPLPSEDDTEQPAQSSSSKRDSASKKKKKKHKRSLDGDEGDELARKSKKKSKKKHQKPEPGEEGLVIESTQREADTENVDPQRKRKSKKSKRHMDPDAQASQQDGNVGELVGRQREGILEREPSHVDDTSADEVTRPASEIQPSSRPRNVKRQTNQNEPHHANEQVVARLATIMSDQSPPSAQQPTPEINADEVPIPKSQPTRGFKTEPPGSDDEDLPFQLSGISTTATSFADATRDPTASITRGREGSLGWIRNREARELNDTPILDNNIGAQRAVDAALPELRPSQIKPERQSDNESGSESSSPSAARLLGLVATARQPPRPVSKGSDAAPPNYGTEPSSPGSNTSIPARTQPEEIAIDESPGGSRSATPAQVKGDAPEKDGSPMEVDEPEAAVNAATARKQARVAITGQKSAAQSVAAEENGIENNTDDVDDGHVLEKAALTANPTQAQSGTDNLSNKKMHIMASRMEQNGTPEHQTPAKTLRVADDGAHRSGSARQPLRSSQRRKAKPSLAPDLPDPAPFLTTEPEAPVLDAVMHQKAPTSPAKRVRKHNLKTTNSQPEPPADTENTHEDRGAEADAVVPENSIRVDSVEPEHSASQRLQKPKISVRQKRTLQSNNADENKDPNADAAASENPSRDDTLEPEQSASQPRPKGGTGSRKRRTLQPKASLSLSQIEGEEDEIDAQSKVSTAPRKSKATNGSRGPSDEPEQSEAVPSQGVGSTQKPRKIKRKRRLDNHASEDEMESLLAAGPSKSRKRKDKKLNSSDDEDARATKRKRLAASDGKAKGPWSEEELRTLGQVVADFRDTNGMTEEDFNKMVHAVPDKTEPLNQDFWNRADLAISRRTRKQIVERTRRIYNSFVARGTWTDEQKEEVHELFETHPEKWAEIAVIINRDQKDVRDYWRNHYLVHQTQIKSRWSEEEEGRLKEVVEEFLGKIRIQRENNDQFRVKPGATGSDDEGLLDWQTISAAMDHTRSRQQCKWKWNDMREKGIVDHDGDTLPLQPGTPGGVNGGISEKLANAREDYRGMSDEDKLLLVEAIHDSQARKDGRIRWSSLVDERFRKKWHRPSLKLIWFRLRQANPEYEKSDVEDNARWLLNHYRAHRTFPVLQDHQVDDQAEEKVINWTRGSRIWTKPSDDPRALRERQKRSGSASSRASSRHSITSRIVDSDDDEAGPSGRKSVDLGEEIEDEQQQQPRGRRRRNARDDVPIRIPKHLNGEAAKKALAEARAKANARKKGKAPARSASVAVDSDGE